MEKVYSGYQKYPVPGGIGDRFKRLLHALLADCRGRGDEPSASV